MQLKALLRTSQDMARMRRQRHPLEARGRKLSGRGTLRGHIAALTAGMLLLGSEQPANSTQPKPIMMIPTIVTETIVSDERTIDRSQHIATIVKRLSHPDSAL